MVSINGNVLSGISTSSTFRIKVPKIINKDSGIFSKLPRPVISNLDTSGSNLIISRQIVNQSVSSKSLSINSQAAFDASS